MSEIGNKLREMRVEAQMTLRDSEVASGVSRTTISLIEQGKQEPRDLTLGKLARAYGVEVGELFERESPKALTLHSPAAEELLSEQGAEWGFLTEDAFASKVHRGNAGDKDSEFERVERELLPEVGAEKVRILDALSTQRPRSADYRRLRREVSAYYNKLIMALINYGAALSGGEVPAQRASEYEFA